MQGQQFYLMFKINIHEIGCSVALKVLKVLNPNASIASWMTVIQPSFNCLGGPVEKQYANSIRDQPPVPPHPSINISHEWSQCPNADLPGS